MSQQTGILKRKKHPGLTLLAGVLSCLLVPVLGLCIAVPQILPFIPLAVLFLYGYVGPVSAYLAVVVPSVLMGVLLGIPASVCTLLYLLPTVVAMSVIMRRKLGFYKGAAVSAAVMLGSLVSAVLFLMILSGSDIVTAFSNMMNQGLRAMGTQADAMLVSMAKAGIIDKPSGLYFSGVLVSSDARAEMISSLVQLLDSGLRLELPAQIVVSSMMTGIFGQAVVRRGYRDPSVERIPMKNWMIPTGWGRVLGITLAIAIGLYYVGICNIGAAYTVETAFSCVLGIQGVAVCWYLLDKKQKGNRILKGILLVLGTTVFSAGLAAVGIADQGFDFAHRRVDSKERGPMKFFGADE